VQRFRFQRFRFQHFSDFTRLANHAEGFGAVAAELDEGGLAEEVAAEEHPVADFIIIEVTGEIGMGEGGGWFDAEHEAEP